MEFSHRALRRYGWRALDRYMRGSTYENRNLMQIAPVLDVWFKVVDRIR
jgi:hypothetical protein